MSADPREVVRAFTDAVTRHDVDRLAELLAGDASYEICGFELPGAGVYDKATVLGILPGMLDLFEPGSPRTEITHMIVDGDWIVAESRAEGRFRNGAPYENRYVFVYEVVDGRVKTLREYMDTQHAATLFAAAGAPS